MLQLHNDVNFNYQMNRAIYLGNGNIEDIKKISSGINDCGQWKNSFIRLEKKLKKKTGLNRLQHTTG